MFYLIVEMMACLVAAAFLGLGVGYIIWGLSAKHRKQDITSLNESLAARTTDLETLKAAAEKAKAAQAHTAAEAKDLHDRIGVLETEAAQHRTRAGEFAASLEKKESEIAGHLQMHVEHDRQLKLLRTEIATKDEALRQQQATKGSADQELESLRERVADAERTIEEKEAALREQQSRTPELEVLRRRTTELEQTLAQKEALLQEQSAALSERDSLRAAVAQLESAVAEKEAAHREHQSQTPELEALRRRTTELEQTLAQKEALLQQHDTTLSERDSLRGAIAQLERAVEEKEAALDEQRSKLPASQALQSKNSELERALAEKDAALQEQKTKLEATHAEALQTLRNKIVELQAAHDEVVKEKNARLLLLRSRVEDLERSLSEKETTLQEQIRQPAEKLAELQAAGATGASAMPQSLSTAAGAGALSGYMVTSRPTEPNAENLLRSLFEPLNREDVSRLASRMKTGSALGDWLQAERQLLFERLDAVRRNWSEARKGAD